MYDFKFADIGEGIHEGKILKWFFKVGDKVKEGETLVIVETDKVNAELPSPVDGVITKIGRAVGETIHVGETVVIINDGGVEAPAVKEEPKKEKLSEGSSAPGVIGEIEVSSVVMASSNEGVSSKVESAPLRHLLHLLQDNSLKI
jgi:pyruvate dehydrogenase E2 component (dihydrolipoamide acetyltransferase)